MEPGENSEIIQKEMLEIRSQMAALTNRFGQYNQKLNELISDKGSIGDRLANDVSAIVGLKEALTSKRRFVRWVWIFLLCVGISATVYDMYEIGKDYLQFPTATSIKIEERPCYPYPPITLCPDGWLDVDKAVSMGLSMDALKYLLAYYSPYISIPIQNVAQARQNFFDVYNPGNYTSLLDFFRALSIEPIPRLSLPITGNESGSFHWCKGCTNNSMTKNFLYFTLCYTSYLEPACPKFGGNSGQRSIILGLENRTQNLIPFSNRMILGICPHFDYMNPSCGAVTIFSNFNSKILIKMAEYNILNTKASPCLEDTGHNRPPDHCRAQCQNRHFKRKFACEMFWLSSPTVSHDPSEFCNYFEPLPNNFTLSEIDDDFAISAMELEDEECFSKCLYHCKRTNYEATLSVQYNLLEGAELGFIEFLSNNSDLSVVSIELTHSAANNGGIVMFTQVPTFSIWQFISNIGGVLGLFIGGTVLTLAQIILFFVNYFIDKLTSRNTSRFDK